MITIFLLLIVFQFKHFIADYPLQNAYMLGKMKATGWFKPLLAHASVHSAFTFVICYLFSFDFSLSLSLAALDLITHFSVDRLKASPSIGGRFNPTQPQFWWCLGADQLAHHLTHYLIIFILIS